MKSNSTHPWVQPIAVLKTSEHEATIVLGALASLLVFIAADSPASTLRFDNWLSGPFAKSVRRGNASQLAKVEEECGELGIGTLKLESPHATVIATWPFEVTEVPKSLSKLQVTGTDFPREVKHPTGANLTIHVLASLTTGKATAQAAHALWQWWLTATETERTDWVSLGYPVALELHSAEALAALAIDAPTVGIRDAGFTEIAPNTFTAIAFQR